MPNDETSVEADSGGTVLIELEPKLSMPQADALSQQLQSHMGRDVDVDASRVESLSTAAVQVLLAAAKSWTVDQCKLNLVNPSEAFLTTLERIGLSPESFKSNEATS
ncbi:STAS domain-containing protein [Amaricoccus tamworthensis]|uniref:STAS domain-containing protein n=1 Tax=Amaricoccus tamworthensis TaxID=57002 RepID=UPI003C7D66F8